MLTSLHTGVCVSCGRESGRLYRVCPFCGEVVYHAPLFRMLRMLAPLLLLGLCGIEIYQNLENCELPVLTPRNGFLVAMATLASLWPVDDGAQIFSTKQNWLFFHLRMLALQFVVFLLALTTLPIPSVGSKLVMLSPLAAFPYLLGLPLRALLGAALLLAVR